jgi:hypothetical protein
MSHTNEQINRYVKQIIFLVITIVSILISISVIKILIDIEKGHTTYKQQKKNIVNKSKVAALIILVATFYFAFDAFKNYKKNQDRLSLNFLIATFLVLIASSIRVINLFYNSNSSLDNDDDII